VRVNSNLFGFLGKSTKGNAQVEPGDSKLLVPGILQPVITTPLPPIGGFNSSTIPAAGIRDTFYVNDERGMTVNGIITLAQLLPGLWRCSWWHWIRAVGAVNDLTSRGELQLAQGPTGQTGTLSRLANTGAFFQSLSGAFDVIVEGTADGTGTLLFLHQVFQGAGTGTNLSSVSVHAHKLL
jgi:hypothetical protein